MRFFPYGLWRPLREDCITPASGTETVGKPVIDHETKQAHLILIYKREGVE
jgi:hypothetical protein